MKETTRLNSATLGRANSRRAVNTGVERGSTVLFESAEMLYNDDVRPTYGTDGLATQDDLRRLLADLEGATESFILPSGLAALTVPIFAFLQAGDEILVVNSCYAPVRRFVETQLKRYGVTARYYDSRLSPADVLALATPATKMIYVESPGSLTFDIQDIPGMAALAKARGILTLCDNTYGGGVLFKPLEHGIDLSMQALTKYVGGHSDVLIGSVSVRDPALAAALYKTIKAWGFFTSADESYLAARGLRTLHLRVKQSGDSALKIARWLETRPEVLRVVHPGLESHPGHDIFARDFTAANGLFMVLFKGNGDHQSQAFLNKLKLFGLGFSWGGYESLAVNCEPQVRGRPKLNDEPDPYLAGSSIRFYVGLEDADDLIADIEQALDLFS
ncbi:cystathionine beta-lyase [Asticcacaulis biprosthecium C19]|uniref:Cystathionine beta-lyase n=1 Tax=Asticcacaulis biprosthecium C19 TaxID=715226 RepID=F4QU57_9CAUL|nr:cystathionine beta-lyase [Asticcacaulis biprosthecium]EGF89357.1 cystathionine beta-lyase [Asticcacaulis biprosthecium C19]